MPKTSNPNSNLYYALVGKESSAINVGPGVMQSIRKSFSDANSLVMWFCSIILSLWFLFVVFESFLTLFSISSNLASFLMFMVSNCIIQLSSLYVPSLFRPPKINILFLGIRRAPNSSLLISSRGNFCCLNSYIMRSLSISYISD